MPAEKTRHQVLVADDEPLIRKFLTVALTQEGHEVETCPDGETVLRRLDQRPFTLLLIDLMMPRKSGAEVIRELRARKDDVPSVIMSSLPADEALAAIAGLERVTFLQKPFSVKELLAAIGKVQPVAPSDAARRC